MSTLRVLVKTRFLVVLMCGWVILGAARPNNAWSQSIDESSLVIETLIRNLENESFPIRELAERDLIRIGMPAARLLAEKAIGGTPESAMRSARILQEIGARANVETDMLRLSCTMDYLANNGFPHFRNSASQIASRWKSEQAGLIRKQIRECGIGFPDIDEDDSFMRGGMQVMVINDGFALESENNVQTPVIRPTLRPGNDVLTAKIDEIFQADEATILSYMKNAVMDGVAEPSIPLGNAGIGRAVIIDGRVVQGRFSNLPAATITSVDERTLKGLELMRLLPSVPHISFTNCEISDELVVELAKVPGLQVISLSRCRYKPVAVLNLLETNPGIAVDATGHDAFLGVSVEAEELVAESGETMTVCTVLTVVPESAAEAAGIQVGDHIFEIDGLRVSEFNHLIVCIASHRVGDEIAIKYESQGEVLETKVALRKRPVLE